MDNSNIVDEEKDGPIPPENEHDGGAKLTKSVDELNDLAIAIQTFKSRYDELQKHLDFIDQAIDKKTKELESLGTTTVQDVTDDGDIVPLESESELKSKSKDGGAGDGEEEEENEIVSLCKTMCSRDLRRFILSHLSETTLLRRQVPVALKSAPNPSKLVFECIGRFFLQGSKAYTKDSPMIPARQASVLVLEYYLLSGCVESEERMESSLKEETASAAIAWRKRLIFEGGVAKACETDARGLILFIGCFGVPDVFRNEDIGNLVRLSNSGEIADALRQSPSFCSKVPDVAEGIMKKGMVIEAVDLAYTFGFEEKISSQSVLTSFLQKSTETWKKTKQEGAPGLHSVQKRANEKYLTALKSVVNCLEGHKVDLVKLLPGWKLKDTIQTLEKDISDLTKKLDDHSAAKRKLETSITSKKVRVPETKRTRFPVKDYSVASPSVAALREQRFASYLDGNSLYGSSLTPHLLEGRSYAYTNNYPTAASVQIGSAPSGGNMLGGAITGSFYGYPGDRVMDNVGTTLNSDSYLYRRHGIGEEALSYDRSVGQSLVGQSSSARVNHLYGKISTDSSIADLGDHLSVGVASRGGGSDLYGFADSVFDT